MGTLPTSSWPLETLAAAQLLREWVPYPRVRVVNELLHGRVHPGPLHVRGCNEQGTTTTPFDMVVLNRMSRYHLALEALRRSRRVPEKGLELARHCQAMLERRHHDYVRENFEDLPEIRGWTWPS